MKLKIYHILILSLLFISLGLDLVLMGLTIYSFATVGAKVDNAIIYMVCFVLIIAFTALEIANTFFSLKDGSRFVKFLIYDDDNKFVNGVFIVSSIFIILSLALSIYSILLLAGLDIAFANLETPMIYIILSFAILVLSNAITVDIFPLLGKQDKAMEMKRERNKRRNDNWKI